MRKLPLLTLLVLIVSVSSVAQTADFTIDAPNGRFCDPYTVTFTQTCTGNPVGFIWNFGNNQRGIHSVETMTYFAGTYNITLTALFANTAITKTKTITVNATPYVSLEANKNYLCKPGTVAFTATGSSFITRYEWNFGDGSPIDTTPSPLSHAYSNYGNYTATVKVIAASGCYDTANYDIRVNKFGINGTMSITNGCIPAEPDFTVTTDLPEGDAPLNYTWNFGDGSSAVSGEGNTMRHRYTTTDPISTANVAIASAQGCNSSFVFPTFAFGTPPLNTKARAIMMKDSFCASEMVMFSGTALNANSFLWQFGDSSEVNIPDTATTHLYRRLGLQNVKTTPMFNGCPGIADSMQIFIKGVIANCNFSNLCGDKKSYQFANSSKGNITHYDWEFSDRPGIKDSSDFNVNHTFPVTGSFKALLSLVDNTTGCTDKVNFNIYTAVPVFSRSISKVCKDSLIVYSVSKSYPDSVGYTYEFHVNGNVVSNGADSVLKYNPETHGSFADYVVINDAFAGTCSDTLQLSSNTIVRGPVVDFTTEETRCFGLPFNFTNNSYPFYPNESIIHWQWTFHDNMEDTSKTPQPHLYTEPGSRKIILVATDINGCAQLALKRAMPIPLPEIIAFPATASICAGKDTVTLAAYTIDTLQWLPATNISCINCDTTRVFPSVTTAYIAQATNQFGCRNYDTCFIKVYTPVHVKVFPSDTSICPGQTISFNAVTNSGNITWEPATYLSKSTIGNPSCVPTGDISYKVTVKDSVGCFADSVTINAKVKPMPSVKAGANQLLPYNTPFNLTPQYSPEVVSYTWEPALGLSCKDCPDPSGNAVKTVTYTVKTKSAEGCTASDKVTIIVQCDQSTLLMPTAFTPNGNGLNEYFYPIARGYKTIKNFIVFNRRGNKVFERKNFLPNVASLGWDGIIKGAETVTASEAFGWYIEAECEQGETIVRKGSVVLVR